MNLDLRPLTVSEFLIETLHGRARTTGRVR